MSNQLTTFSSPKATGQWLASMHSQMAVALPKHLNADRMSRLVLTAFGTNPALAESTPMSVAAAVMTACQLGLEIGINGQAYLIPYKDRTKNPAVTVCTFVPGWKGLVDLCNRGGRCTVWTGAVYKGDHFDYALGDRPFVNHKPGDELQESYANLMFVYACGRIRGQELPVIEVWSRAKIDRHLDKFNKQGDKHYALAKNKLNYEMYARKIPLLQVLKYMPQSVELTAAMMVQNAADDGRTIELDPKTWLPVDGSGGDNFGMDDGGADTGATSTPAPGPKAGNGGAAASTPPAAKTDHGFAASTNGKPPITDEELAKRKGSLVGLLEAGDKVADVITALETRNSLTADQKMEIASWAQPQGDKQ